MNLVVEIGNTNQKWATFDTKGELIECAKVPNLPDSKPPMLLHHQDIDRVIIASSGRIEDSLLKHLSDQYGSYVTFDTKLIPLRSQYVPPSDMGQDRWINAYYASILNPDGVSLVVDCGTCITTTIVSIADGIIGGSISPGVSLRARAMHRYTAVLPMAHIADAPLSKISNNTMDNLANGSIWGAVAEIEKRIEWYQAEYPSLQVFLTGGDTEIVMNKIKFCIFADYYFTLKGLNHLLSHL